MRKKGLIKSSVILFAFALVLSFGLLIQLPGELTAAAPDGTAGASAPAGTAGASVPAGEGAADGTAGASVPLPHYEPLEVKPIHNEANNVLLGSGLGIAVMIIGGSLLMDKRKR